VATVAVRPGSAESPMGTGTGGGRRPGRGAESQQNPGRLPFYGDRGHGVRALSTPSSDDIDSESE
jgi:hypothetical protein